MPTFYMMIGLPASGKSTHAKVLQRDTGAVLLSSDTIRERMFGTEYNPANNQLVFAHMNKLTKRYLTAGQSVVYDATNMSFKLRKALLDELKKILCRKEAILMATPYDECVRRNSTREAKVPEDVIHKMWYNFSPPYYYEGWDFISIMYSNVIKTSISEFLSIADDFNQDNSHHTATLGMHCTLAGEHLGRDSFLLSQAGMLHDIGKLHTKKFLDESKDPSEAHYYNHQNVGAYESLFYNTLYSLYISVLIYWHMIPYEWERTSNAGLMEKYKTLWGDTLFEDIMLLHEADKKAH